MPRNIFPKLGNKTNTGKEKCLTGIGDSQVLSIVILVEIDNMHIKVEFHGVPDDCFDVILGRTILDIVDMKVTKEALSLRVRMNQKVTKIILSISYPSFCKKSSFGSH